MPMTFLESTVQNWPILLALVVFGAFVFAGGRASVREYVKMQRSLQSLRDQILPVTEKMEDIQSRLVTLEEQFLKSRDDNASKTAAQLFDLTSHMTNLKTDVETMNSEQAMSRAIDMAQKGASPEIIHQATNVSRIEAEALVRFHSDRHRNPTSGALAG